MRCPSFACLMVLNILAALAVELPAQDPTPETSTSRRFNQVFVKVVVPVTSRTQMQRGPVIESWVAKHLKQLGAPECFAVARVVAVHQGQLAVGSEGATVDEPAVAEQ